MPLLLPPRNVFPSEERDVRMMDLPLSPAGFLLWENAHAVQWAHRECYCPTFIDPLLGGRHWSLYNFGRIPRSSS